MFDVKKLREEWNQLQTDNGKVMTAAHDAKRSLSAEEKAANDKRYTRIDEIRAQIAEAERFASYAVSNPAAEDVKNRLQLPNEPAGKDEFNAAEGRSQFAAGHGEKFNAELFRRQFRMFAQTGDSRQLYTVTTSTGTNAYLPKEVMQPVAVRRLQNCFRGALAAAGMIAMEIPSPSTVSLPVNDDTGNTGETPGESGTGTSLDPTDASLSVAPTLYGSKAFWYSNTMVMAHAFDVLNYTLPMAQMRVDKSQESAWTTAVMALSNLTRTAATGAITYAELLTWEHALAAAYRIDAVFLVADSLYKALRGLVDTNGRPILDLDPTNTFVGKIHGKPVIVGDYFQTFATNHKCGAFISASAIKIVDMGNARLARYSSLPTKQDQIGFELFQNGDAAFMSSGVAVLGTAIS